MHRIYVTRSYDRISTQSPQIEEKADSDELSDIDQNRAALESDENDSDVPKDKESMSAARKLRRRMIKNAQKSTKVTSDQTKCCSMTTYVLKELFEATTDDRSQLEVRLSEFFDQPYNSENCIKNSMLFYAHPYLGLTVAEAYILLSPEALTIDDELREENVRDVQRAVLFCVMRFDVATVNRTVLTVVDSAQTTPVVFVKTLKRKLGDTFTNRSAAMLQHDSVLMPRIPNVCPEFSHYGLCRKTKLSIAEKAVHRRHLCTQEGCNDSRIHSTPQCDSSTLRGAVGKHVNDFINWHVEQQNSRRGGHNKRGRGNKGRGAKR